jgi:uncharacterized protein with GYD domain
MATYIGLVKYTQQGIAAIKDSPKRLDDFKKLCEQHGAKVQSFFLTMGRCDLVVVIEAPDDATVAKVILKVSSGGNVSTETLRAFPEAEYRQIVASL